MTETTTEAVTQETGATAQPEEQQAEAVTTPVSESTSTPPESPPESPAEEAAQAAANPDEHVEFWSKKGIDISTPEGLAKATKSYQEAESAMHRKNQEASELAKKLQEQPVEVDTDNELLREVVERDVQRDRKEAVNDFIRANDITPEQDLALGEWLGANPQKTQAVLNGTLTLEEAFKLSGVGDKNPDELKKQGGKEALEQLASKQRSAAPKGGATTSTPPASDPIMEALLKEK